MEEQAQTLLATLRKSSVPIETKLATFNNLKSSIKHLRVPEGSQATIFECIKLAVSAQTSPTLVSTGFSTLGHLIKRLSLQEQTSIIASQTNKLLPILLDRLGDPRESHRNAASQTLSDLWPYCHAEVEKTVREGAIAGHNARAKDMGMLWVVKVRSQPYMYILSDTHFVADEPRPWSSIPKFRAISGGLSRRPGWDRPRNRKEYCC
jgi:CLIP-associating protein 1/2